MIPLILVLVTLAGAGAAFAVFPGRTKNTVLTGSLSVPSDGITVAKVEINPGDGNLRIDPLDGSQPLLVSGTMQYSEKQGEPTQSLNDDNGQAVFSAKANPGARPWLALPWAACNGATEWNLS